MKNSTLLALLFSTTTVLAQPSDGARETAQTSKAVSASGPDFEWENKEHDFGTIPKGNPVTAEFKFTNTGNKPMILTNVKSTCGCTVPVWPKQPILPGEEATIKATYNAKNPGAFTKKITVVSNAKDNYIYLLLKGNVKAEGTNSDQL